MSQNRVRTHLQQKQMSWWWTGAALGLLSFRFVFAPPHLTLTCSQLLCRSYKDHLVPSEPAPHLPAVGPALIWHSTPTLNVCVCVWSRLDDGSDDTAITVGGLFFPRSQRSHPTQGRIWSEMERGAAVEWRAPRVRCSSILCGEEKRYLFASCFFFQSRFSPQD